MSPQVPTAQKFSKQTATRGHGGLGWPDTGHRLSSAPQHAVSSPPSLGLQGPFMSPTRFCRLLSHL